MGYGIIEQNSLPITSRYFYCALVCVCGCVSKIHHHAYTVKGEGDSKIKTLNYLST